MLLLILIVQDLLISNEMIIAGWMVRIHFEYYKMARSVDDYVELVFWELEVLLDENAKNELLTILSPGCS